MKHAMALVAHADDETLGAGGTIAKLQHDGWHLSVVIVSDAHRYTDQRENRSDAQRACDILGVHDLHFLGIPDQKFDSVPMAEIVDAALRLKLEPDLIITHADSDLNLDHRWTAEVARVVGRPRSRPISILACEIPNSSFWNGASFAADYFVDIGEQLDTKIEAFSQYGNEMRSFPDAWSPEGLRLLAQFRGMQCGLLFAEAFHLIRGYEGLLPGARGR